MHITRRQLLAMSLACAPAAIARHAMAQQGYPSRPVTIVAPFAPGGNIDVVARTLSIPLGKTLGQSVVVDNRPGAGGAIGTAMVARAEPDGYNLLIAVPSQLSTLPHLFKTPYRMDSFVPIGLTARTTMILVARKNDARFATFEKFVELARSAPGALSAGHAGPGTPNHMALLRMEDAVRGSFNAIAYKGSGPALTNLLGGQIDLVFDQIVSSMPYLKSGDLQALAVLSTAPDPALPGVPLLAERGLPGFDATTYTGLLAPAGTPPEVVATVASALDRSLDDKTLVETLGAVGSYTMHGDGQAFTRLLEEESQLAAKFVAEGRLVTN